MTMLPPSNEPVRDLTDAQEERMKAERMRDVRILLEHLANSQETTVKMILDCLYDIGATNWVNNKFRARPLNRTMKSVARMSKPVFRRLALRWFKRNCPQLIANWLYLQVKFQPAKIKKKVKQELGGVPANPRKALAARDREVQELRSQVRLLTGGLVLAIALLGGTSGWLGYKLQLAQNQQVQQPNPEALVRDRE